jgi:hypothetical protein
MRKRKSHRLGESTSKHEEMSRHYAGTIAVLADDVHRNSQAGACERAFSDLLTLTTYDGLHKGHVEGQGVKSYGAVPNSMVNSAVNAFKYHCQIKAKPRKRSK